MNIEQNIKNMEAELEKMKLELAKSKEFNWEYIENKTYLLEEYRVGAGYDGTLTHALDHGIYRKTKANAELSLARNRQANLIEALAEQFGSDGSGSYYIYKQHDRYYNGSRGSYIPGLPTMSSKIANKVCDVLNNKDIIL